MRNSNCHSFQRTIIMKLIHYNRSLELMTGSICTFDNTHHHSEVYCGYFRCLVLGNSLTFSHIPLCFMLNLPISPCLTPPPPPPPRVTSSIVCVLFSRGLLTVTATHIQYAMFYFRTQSLSEGEEIGWA